VNQPPTLTVTEADAYHLIALDDGKANAVSQETADALLGAFAAAAAAGRNGSRPGSTSASSATRPRRRRCSAPAVGC
jgi:hypothetical protein